MMFERSHGPTEITPHVKVLLSFWLLLLPWLIFAPLSGMAFDGGSTFKAYTFFWSTLTYPITLCAAFLLRRKAPMASLLPVLNLVGFIIGGF